MPLYDILNEFQKGHSHIAVVYKDVKETLKNVKEGETLEASLMKGVNIYSHSSSKGVYVFTLSISAAKILLLFHTHIFLICMGKWTDEKVVGSAAESKSLEPKLDSDNGQMYIDHGDGGQKSKKSPPATPAFKKRHRGCSFCILDIENGPIPVFPPSQEVVGVITMEDVIEELLQVTLNPSPE